MCGNSTAMRKTHGKHSSVIYMLVKTHEGNNKQTAARNTLNYIHLY